MVVVPMPSSMPPPEVEGWKGEGDEEEEKEEEEAKGRKAATSSAKAETVVGTCGAGAAMLPDKKGEGEAEEEEEEGAWASSAKALSWQCISYVFQQSHGSAFNAAPTASQLNWCWTAKAATSLGKMCAPNRLLLPLPLLIFRCRLLPGTFLSPPSSSPVLPPSKEWADCPPRCCCCCGSVGRGDKGDGGASLRSSSCRWSKVLWEMQSWTSRPSSWATAGPVLFVERRRVRGLVGWVVASFLVTPCRLVCGWVGGWVDDKGKGKEEGHTYNLHGASSLGTRASAAPRPAGSKAGPGAACPAGAPPRRGRQRRRRGAGAAAARRAGRQATRGRGVVGVVVVVVVVVGPGRCRRRYVAVGGGWPCGYSSRPRGAVVGGLGVGG